MDAWMTLEEVAQYLKVSKDSIYRLAQKGEMPASKIGNLWRFKKEEIDEWMKNTTKMKRR
ncbi:helix-turn-helix domain-containing protein [Candidatus Omnitrophota bacterium]